MFGPVPAKYRLLVWMCGLAAFAGLGAWVSASVPLSTPVMIALGLSLGGTAVALFLHDFGHAPARRVVPSPSRHRRR